MLGGKLARKTPADAGISEVIDDAAEDVPGMRLANGGSSLDRPKKKAGR
jgi:hypothetical protein